MAGRRTSGTRDERSSADEASSPARATPSGAAPGPSAGAIRRSTRRLAPVVHTRRTVHLLTLRGLAPAEAANLTAFLCGIPVADRHWELREINQLLFLRDLNRRGRFGGTDGAT